MATTLSNKRTQFNVETENAGRIKLTGELVLNESNEIQNFNGQIKPILEDETDPYLSYGTFSYSLNNDNANHQLFVPSKYTEYLDEASILLNYAIREIRQQIETE